MEQQKRGSRAKVQPALRAFPVSAEPVSRPIPISPEPILIDAVRALRELHLLLRSARRYERHHPRMLQSLDRAYESLRAVVGAANGLEIRVERSGLVAPKLSDAPLPDVRGDLYDLAADLHRAGIHNLVFAPKFHVGELDTLAQLAKGALLQSGHPTKQEALAWWPAKLLESRVEGIAVNTQIERKVDTVLASLIAALVAYGGHYPPEDSGGPRSTHEN